MLISPLLVYVTGGLAYGEEKSNTAVGESCNSNTPAATCSVNFVPAVGSSSSIKAGYTLGGGVEYAMLYGWSLRGEYLYYHLGSLSYGLTPLAGIAGAASSAPGVLVSAVGLTSNTPIFKGSIARVGLNYKFGYAAAPAVYK